MRRTPVPPRRLLALLGATVALLVPVAIAGADTGEVGSSPDVTAGQMTHDLLGAWFVQLSGAPVADGGNAAALTAKRQKFHADAKAAGITYSTRYEFQKLWNGVSVDISVGQLEKVLGLPNVVGVSPVGIVSIPETQPASLPDLATAIKMTGADIAQSDLGYTGDGVKVAVMDTGVDLDHADLGGDGTAGAPHANSRVVSQWDFVGDAYNADPSSTAFSPTPVPDPVADDCNGHGTHVAGIVGADGDVTGVAPGVDFGAYRVFGCDGSTTDEVMIAAMERALDDDMDVLNMSIGDAFNNWHQSPTGQASTNLVKRGVVVVASIGNSGANGVYSGGVPGMGDKVIGVASFDNSHVALTTFTVSPDDTPIGYGNAAAAPPAPTSGTLPLDRTGTPTTLGDGCVNPPAPGSMTGKAVLIRRGSAPAPAPACTFHAKALAAQNAGAAAVILYNNVAGRFSPTVAGSPAITIPVVADLRHGRRAHRRADRCRPDDDDLDRRSGLVHEPDRRSHLVVQLVRSRGRARPQARHRRTRWPDPLDVPARGGRVRDGQRHLDGVPARRGRRRAAAPGEAEHEHAGRSGTSSRTAPTRLCGGGTRVSASWTTSTGRAPGCSTSTTRSSPRPRSRPASSRSARAQSGPAVASAGGLEPQSGARSRTTCRS